MDNNDVAYVESLLRLIPVDGSVHIKDLDKYWNAKGFDQMCSIDVFIARHSEAFETKEGGIVKRAATAKILPPLTGVGSPDGLTTIRNSLVESTVQLSNILVPSPKENLVTNTHEGGLISPPAPDEGILDPSETVRSALGKLSDTWGPDVLLSCVKSYLQEVSTESSTLLHHTDTVSLASSLKNDIRNVTHAAASQRSDSVLSLPSTTDMFHCEEDVPICYVSHGNNNNNQNSSDQTLQLQSQPTAMTSRVSNRNISKSNYVLPQPSESPYSEAPDNNKKYDLTDTTTAAVDDVIIASQPTDNKYIYQSSGTYVDHFLQAAKRLSEEPLSDSRIPQQQSAVPPAKDMLEVSSNLLRTAVSQMKSINIKNTFTDTSLRIDSLNEVELPPPTRKLTTLSTTSPDEYNSMKMSNRTELVSQQHKSIRSADYNISTPTDECYSSAQYLNKYVDDIGSTDFDVSTATNKLYSSTQHSNSKPLTLSSVSAPSGEVQSQQLKESHDRTYGESLREAVEAVAEVIKVKEPYKSLTELESSPMDRQHQYGQHLSTNNEMIILNTSQLEERRINHPDTSPAVPHLDPILQAQQRSLQDTLRDVGYLQQHADAILKNYLPQDDAYDNSPTVSTQMSREARELLLRKATDRLVVDSALQITLPESFEESGDSALKTVINMSAEKHSSPPPSAQIGNELVVQSVADVEALTEYRSDYPVLTSVIPPVDNFSSDQLLNYQPCETRDEVLRAAAELSAEHPIDAMNPKLVSSTREYRDELVKAAAELRSGRLPAEIRIRQPTADHLVGPPQQSITSDQLAGDLTSVETLVQVSPLQIITSAPTSPHTRESRDQLLRTAQEIRSGRLPVGTSHGYQNILPSNDNTVSSHGHSSNFETPTHELAISGADGIPQYEVVTPGGYSSLSVPGGDAMRTPKVSRESREELLRAAADLNAKFVSSSFADTTAETAVVSQFSHSDVSNINSAHLVYESSPHTIPEPDRLKRLPLSSINSNNIPYADDLQKLIANPAGINLYSDKENYNGYVADIEQPQLTNTSPNYIEYRAHEEYKGIISWLGTDSMTGKFSNPSLSGKVSVMSSGFESGCAADIVDCAPRVCCTADELNSWIKITLNNCTVIPTYYTLAYAVPDELRGVPDSNYSVKKLLTWDLIASTDGVSYQTISRHIQDDAFGPSDHTHDVVVSFKITLSEPSQQYFRHFQIISTGPNTAGGYSVDVSGFELYGLVKKD